MGRKKQERRFKMRYAVLGEGLTEQWYLKHLRESKGYVYAIRPSLFADVSIEKAEGIIDELLSGGCDQITFLTDYDTVVSQGKKEVFDKLKAKYKDVDEVLICDSMPCIEIWFLLHYTYTSQEFRSFADLKYTLINHMPSYKKTKGYLEKPKWFNDLVANNGIEKATENANKLLRALDTGGTGEHFPFTRMPLALEEFERQKNNR